MASSIRSNFGARVKRQGDRPTCVAFAVSSLHEYWLDVKCANRSPVSLDLSEEFLFFNCKQRDGLARGSGTTVIAASASLKVEGQCLEHLHPYEQSKRLPAAPSQTAIADGKRRTLNSLVSRNVDLRVLEEALGEDRPVVGVIELFRGCYRPDQNGLLPLPSSAEKRIALHAVLMVDIEATVPHASIVFMNSWGAKWGDQGYGRFSHEYFRQHCTELWTVSS
jgi:C1A family cysteine protease